VDYTLIFGLANLSVLPLWFLIILLPHWSITRRIIGSPLVALVPATIYLVLVGPQIATLLSAVSNPSLSGITTLLATPAGATIAWAHFLAFDLLVGRWVYLDARERGISALLIAPVLFLTFMLGPIGQFGLLSRAWRINSTLTIFTFLALLLTIIGVIGLIFDPRIVLGMPNWAKSTKFGLSLGLYGATLLWLLPLLQSRPRLAGFVGHASGGILSLEIVLLAVQAIRGVPMHFNVSTPFDSTLWGFMSVTIMAFWVVTLIAVILAMLQPVSNRILAWGVRLGLLIVLIGFAEGFLMPPPTPTQMAALQAGQQVHLIGAHTVGAADGGPGIPFLGWSTQHGDLRVGHFIGIHGIQAIALLALLLMRRPEQWLTIRHRVTLVWIGAISYLGLVVLVTWQALRGQPLLSPDTLTLTSLGGLIATGLIATAIVFVHARRAPAALSPDPSPMPGRGV